MRAVHPVSLTKGLLLATTLLALGLAACAEETTPTAPAAQPSPTPTVTLTPLPSTPTVIPTDTAMPQQAEEALAPSFSLPAADGRQVTLAELLQDHSAVVLVFYRGFF